jgi:CRISPR-associated protein Csy1
MQMHFLSKEIENFIFGKLNLKNTKNTKKDGLGVNRLCSSEDLNNWINVAAEKAKQLKFVTHAVKYTHSDAKGTSVNIKTAPLDFNLDLKRNYITTFSLKELEFDVVGNAAALDVAKFLSINDGDKTLLDYIVEGDYTPLKQFSNTKEQLETWVEGFKKILLQKGLASHTLSKQIYFPIGEEQYHLLSPLYATSFAHCLYERINTSRFSEQAIEIRALKKQNLFCESKAVSYPNTAIFSYGGGKSLNISLLNAKHRGNSYLLSCAPPIWKTISKPPIKYKSIFSKYKEYDQRTYPIIKELKAYLIKIQSQSSSKPIRDIRADYIDTLMDILISYAAEIQNMHTYRGWTKEAILPDAQKFWLDPYREDDLFQEDRKNKDWQKNIADEFSKWLGKKLKDESYVLGDVEWQLWRDLLEQKLKLININLKEC